MMRKLRLASPGAPGSRVEEAGASLCRSQAWILPLLSPAPSLPCSHLPQLPQGCLTGNLTGPGGQLCRKTCTQNGQIPEDLREARVGLFWVWWAGLGSLWHSWPLASQN